MSLSQRVKAFGVSRALDYFEKDPDANLPKLMEWMDKFGGERLFPTYHDVFQKALSDPENNWYKLIKSMYSDIDNRVLKHLFETFIVCGDLLDWPSRSAQGGWAAHRAPWSVIIDPCFPCHMDCKGCGAAIFGVRPDMGFDGLDEEIETRKAQGTYLYIFSGGNPLSRGSEIIALCNKHADCVFAVFTPPEAITGALAEDILRVGNLFPAIRADGAPDAAADRAMALLKLWRLPFGVACRCTAGNTDAVGTEDYYDALLAQGAKFCWFFTCPAFGSDRAATGTQLAGLHQRVRQFRRTKPLLTLDFWDAPSPSATARENVLLDGGTV